MPDLATFVRYTMPAIIERVPGPPAQLLGRLAAPEDPPARPWLHRPPRLPHEDGCLGALRSLGGLVPERLLGALERFVAGHDWSVERDLLEGLAPPPLGQRFAFAAGGSGAESEAIAAARMLDSLRQGVAERTAALVREVAADPAVAPLLLAVDGGDEAAIAAAHGTVHIALGIAVAGAVVHQAEPPVIVDRTAAAVGLGLGAAALLLRGTAMPGAYAAARLTRTRAEYLYPRHHGGQVQVRGHRFALAERDLPALDDFSATGLVAGTDGGAVIRTGIAEGWLHLSLIVLAEPPAELETGWEEAAEVSWRALEGQAALGQMGKQTPPWPGDYRLRVYARGRDEADQEYEQYRLVVWAAPAAPPVVLHRTDRLGHRLRGEPEPVRAPRPEHAYRWLRRTALAEAGTVTVVTGATVAEVLHAFGADPDRPERVAEFGVDSLLRVLDTGDAVLAVEPNGYAGSHAEVIRKASTGGRAASMYWSINGNTRLTLAERGHIVPGTEFLHDLDFDDYGERPGKGLVAVERFTGRGLAPEDVDRIRDSGIGYRVHGQ